MPTLLLSFPKFNLNSAKFRANMAVALHLLLLAGTVSCRRSTIKSEPRKLETRSDTQLVLNDAVLEQSNKQDNTIWRIKADNIVYSEDKQTATLDRVVGNLLQDGKIVLKISAETAEVRDNGNSILLKEEIIASDSRNGSVINGSVMQWRPQENLLLVEDRLRGMHEEVNITANSGRYLTDRERLELEDNVVATTNDPALQLTSDRLVWNIPQNSIKSPGAITIIRYDDNQTVTDRLVGDRAEVDLTRNLAIVNQNVELVTLDPRLQAATDSFIWNYQQRIGMTNSPIQILDRDRQISLTGNGGEIDLTQQTAKLENGVRGINRQADQLYARQLTWNINTQEVEAVGNVVYEQADPQARLTGEKAIGTLENNNITVTSDGKQQVTTTIDN